MSAKWTFMVYMAGNNSLSGAASADLREMGKVGSSEAVKMLAFVKQENGPARHVVVGKAGHDEVVALAPTTDSGDPQTVIDFVRWAVTKAPAERYALVLWNHGGGWSPDDFDQLYQQARGGRTAAAHRHEANRLSSRKLSRVLFKTSAQRILALDDAQSRAICSDDVSGHSLDTLEVARVLELVRSETGRPLDLFGMDACLMSTLEVAYETRDQVRTVVGSEELEPGAGWCYDVVLADLAAAPEIDGPELAKRVTKHYVDSYRSHSSQWPVTQCAVDAARVESFASTVDALVGSLRASLPGSWPQIVKAQACATQFEFEMADLRTFCRGLVARTSDANVRSAAEQVIAALVPGGYVLAEGHLGPKVEDCGGVSIYLPSPNNAQVSPYYKDLAFAKRQKWADFLAGYFRAVRG
jgi:hypothetical protein